MCATWFLMRRQRGYNRTRLVTSCNTEISQSRQLGGRVIFANFVLACDTLPLAGRNKMLTALSETGRFNHGDCLPEIKWRLQEDLYLYPRVSSFSNTSIHEDPRRQGADRVRMAGISSSGVVLSSVARASDADYEVQHVRSCCFDPDAAGDDALFRTGFATRATVVD